MRHENIQNMAEPVYYHVRNIPGVVCRVDLYNHINAKLAMINANVRFGPPAHGGVPRTKEIDTDCSTGIYMVVDEPVHTLRLEEAIAILYEARGIEPKGANEAVRTSAQRTCS